ncbi:MAG TPA: hypothetical protein VLE96_05390 [Chlamydiales bacterium]|nr:hypothetical protein [Chlamydiales bacterium]
MQQSKTLESLENIYLSISVKWPLWAFISEKEYIRKKCEISGFENKNHLLQKIQSKLYKAIFPIFLIAFFLLFSIYLIVNYNNCKLEIQNIAYYKKHLPGELYHSFLEQKLFGNNLREQHNPKGGYRLIVEKTNDPKIGEFVAIHYQARHSGSISLGYQNQNLTNYVLIDQWGSDYVSSTPCSKNEEDKIVNFLVNDVVPIFKNKF